METSVRVVEFELFFTGLLEQIDALDALLRRLAKGLVKVSDLFPEMALVRSSSYRNRPALGPDCLRREGGRIVLRGSLAWAAPTELMMVIKRRFPALTIECRNSAEGERFEYWRAMLSGCVCVERLIVSLRRSMVRVHVLLPGERSRWPDILASFRGGCRGAEPCEFRASATGSALQLMTLAELLRWLPRHGASRGEPPPGLLGSDARRAVTAAWNDGASGPSERLADSPRPPYRGSLDVVVGSTAVHFVGTTNLPAPGRFFRALSAALPSVRLEVTAETRFALAKTVCHQRSRYHRGGETRVQYREVSPATGMIVSALGVSGRIGSLAELEWRHDSLAPAPL